MKINKFELCDCGAVAKWCYMPGYSSGCNPYSCDDCVHRGCSCNTHSIKEEYRDLPEEKEGIDWEWLKVNDDRISFEISEPNTYWWHIDEQQRPYPCCEYDNSPNGYYTEEYEQFLESECKRIGYDLTKDVDGERFIKEYGHILWTDDLIERIEKLIEEYNLNN